MGKFKVLKSGEKLIAKETDYRSGSIGWFGTGVNDAYDIYLSIVHTEPCNTIILFNQNHRIAHDFLAFPPTVPAPLPLW